MWLTRILNSLPKRNFWRMNNKQETLEPSFSLAKKILKSKRRFLPHVTVNETKQVALASCYKSKVSVLCHRAVRSNIVANIFLSAHLQLISQ